MQEISDAMVPKDLQISDDEEEALEAELAALMQQPGQISEQKQEIELPSKQEIELPSVAGLPLPRRQAAEEEKEEPEKTISSPAALHA